MTLKIIRVMVFATILWLQADAQEGSNINDSLPTTTIPAQVDTTRQAMNGWYVQIAGESLIGVTINYELYLSRKPGGFSMHAGIGGIYINVNGNSAGYVTIPLGLSYNIPTSPRNRSFIELGGGYTYTSVGSGNSGGFYPVVGWRYLAKPTGLQLRATCLPFIKFDGQTIAPFFGFSIGTKFRGKKSTVASTMN